MGEIFDESWYRVAPLRLGLSDSVEVSKQDYRGETWYVLRDPFNNQFFRVRPSTYYFLAKLDLAKTVEEVWSSVAEEMPEDAPSQTEVIRLISQLHNANMLHFTSRPNHDLIFKRYKDKERKSLIQKLMTFLYIRVPLWDPDRFLDKAMPFIKPILSWFGLALWLFVIGLGIKAVLDNHTEMGSELEGVLAPSNLILLYVSMAFLKLLHEFGHAFVTKMFGGQVNTMGVMFLIFTPLPYVDVNSSWAFRYKWQRILVGSAGMMVELFIAAIAAVVFVNTDDDLIHALSFNIMFIGSVSSLLFNGNPLLKFDAYFMLSDLLAIPNLQKRSQEQWYFYIEKYLFSSKSAIPPSSTQAEASILSIYAILSLAYRLFITLGIILFVGDQWFEIGVLITLLSIYMWIIKPASKVYSYLFLKRAGRPNNLRIYSVTASIFAALLNLIWIVPLPYSIQADGIVRISDTSSVYAKTPGFVAKVYVKDGETVEPGDVIAQLQNEELVLDIDAIQAQIDESKLLLKKFRDQEVTHIKIIEEQILFLAGKLQELKRRQNQLLIRARQKGVWVGGESLVQGRWLHRQKKAGSIINKNHLEFLAVVNQEKAFDLFKMKGLQGTVKLFGYAEETLQLDKLTLIPYEKNELPSAALGWSGGGNLPVDTQDPEGTKTIEPFFELQGQLVVEGIAPSYSMGHSGHLHVDLPKQTVAQRVYRSVKQVLQKRYQL